MRKHFFTFMMIVVLFLAGKMTPPLQPQASFIQAQDIGLLGQYHFEYGTDQGWFAQAGESQNGIQLTVIANQEQAWTGKYSLKLDASQVQAGSWWAAAGTDSPAPAYTPQGQVTAHVFSPAGSSASWARIYILDQNWQWFSSSEIALTPGDWTDIPWNLAGLTPSLPIQRLGIQFGGVSSANEPALIYLDAISWTRTPSDQHLTTGAYLSGGGNEPFSTELTWLDQVGNKHAGIINLFAAWADPYPVADVSAIINHRSTPMITWMPNVPLTDITAGKYDTVIDTWAHQIHNSQAEIYLRFGHEMNGCNPGTPPQCWYPWAGNPAAFKNAWQYVHQRMSSQGANNIRWVWTPMATQEDLYNDFPDYYPGDAFVDLVGASGFNWAGKADWDPHPPCFTFDQIFSPILSRMADLYDKPQIVAEFATACDNGCNKSLWIAEAYYQALFYPRLQALVWFNTAKQEGSTWVDWRLGCGDCSSPACTECLDAYQGALTDPHYLEAAPGFLPQRLFLPLAQSSAPPN